MISFRKNKLVLFDLGKVAYDSKVARHRALPNQEVTHLLAGELAQANQLS